MFYLLSSGFNPHTYLLFILDTNEKYIFLMISSAKAWLRLKGFGALLAALQQLLRLWKVLTVPPTREVNIREV